MEYERIQLGKYVDSNLYCKLRDLEKTCRDHDGVMLKLELDYKLSNWENSQTGAIDRVNEFTYWKGDQLVGYIGIDDFGNSTLEVNGMVHPGHRRCGIFKKLFSLLRDEWKRREGTRLLLLTDEASGAGKSFIQSLGARFHHSELEMTLSPKAFEKREFGNLKVSLRPAENGDAIEIARQNSIYFEEDLLDQPLVDIEKERRMGFHIFMAEHEGVVVGKANLHLTGNEGGIFGLGILPQWRGKGLGRDLLISSVLELKKLGAERIFLQVDDHNEKALKMYTSCGFKEDYVMNYYLLEKNEGGGLCE